MLARRSSRARSISVMRVADAFGVAAAGLFDRAG